MNGSLLGSAWPLLLVAAGVSAGCCAVLVPMLRRLALVDLPGDRSSHAGVVPRGGGIGLMAGVLLATVLADEELVRITEGEHLTAHPGVLVTTAVAGAVAYALLGLVDDVRGLSPGARSAVQLLIGLMVGWALAEAFDLSPVWVVLGSVAAAAYVNVTNFMDGLNGVSAGHGIVVGASYAALGALAGEGWLVVLGAATAGASLGFLPWNLFRAKLFLGDVGSYGLGGLIAVSAGAAFFAGLPPEACLAPLAIYLADVAHTLVMRARAAEPLHLPHRTHAYQRLVDSGWSHAQAAAWVSGCTALTALLGAASLSGWSLQRLVADVLIVGVVALHLKAPSWRGAPSPWGRTRRFDPV